MLNLIDPRVRGIIAENFRVIHRSGGSVGRALAEYAWCVGSNPTRITFRSYNILLVIAPLIAKMRDFHPIQVWSHAWFIIIIIQI